MLVDVYVVSSQTEIRFINFCVVSLEIPNNRDFQLSTNITDYLLGMRT